MQMHPSVYTAHVSHCIPYVCAVWKWLYNASAHKSLWPDKRSRPWQWEGQKQERHPRTHQSSNVNRWRIPTFSFPKEIECFYRVGVMVKLTHLWHHVTTERGERWDFHMKLSHLQNGVNARYFVVCSSWHAEEIFPLEPSWNHSKCYTNTYSENLLSTHSHAYVGTKLA